MGHLWMPCTIENTGFSSERRFEVQWSGGGKIVGAAYVAYLRDQNKQEIPEGHPPLGQAICGYVQCRLRRKEGSLFVEFPGTEVFHVPQEALDEAWQG
jgi:hypothetical protein